MKNKTIFDDGVFHPENEQDENLNIFREAFNDKDSMIISQTNGYYSSPNSNPVNCSDIATKLIQEAGRYCESHASDFLITWENVTEALRLYKTDRTRPVLVIFGLRESGVDHAQFILSVHKSNKHTCGYLGLYYRKIYAVEITSGNKSDEIIVTLKDIKHQLTHRFWKQIQTQIS